MVAAGLMRAQPFTTSLGLAQQRARPIVAARPTAVRQRAVKTYALLDMFKNKGNTVKKEVKPRFETVELEPAYNLQLALIAIAGAEVWQGWYLPAAFFGLLGAFLTYQTGRVKFIFDDEALEIKIYNKESENVVVGGQNRWAYSSFANWELWWPGFPVLFYFKETQTKPEGQIHFFPIIFNGQQLYKLAKERCGPSATTK